MPECIFDEATTVARTETSELPLLILNLCSKVNLRILVFIIFVMSIFPFVKLLSVSLIGCLLSNWSIFIVIFFRLASMQHL